MNAKSKVWIYQANRKLTLEEVKNINTELEIFCKNWAAHNVQLEANSEIRYNQFIILKVDESNTNASGCSIDSSVRFLHDLENKYQIELFNRMLFAYKNENEIITLNKDEFQEAINTSKIKSDTLVFNNLVQNIEQLETQWELPFDQSWHKNLFQTLA